MSTNRRKLHRLPSPDMDKDEQLALITAAAERAVNSVRVKAGLPPVRFTYCSDSPKSAPAARPKSKQSKPRSASARTSKRRKETEQ